MTELERQSHVEEMWARRTVFAPIMNADRLDDWHERRALMILADMGPLVLPWRPRAADVIQFRGRAA